MIYNLNMVKRIFLISFLILVSFSLVPSLVAANGLVPECGGRGQPRCEWKHFEEMIGNIVNFILFTIVPVVAGLMFVIGGIVFLVSGGSPNLQSLGKKIMLTTIIGAAIAFGALAIIHFILKAIGYIGKLP